MATSTLAEGRRGKNIRHRLLGLLRQAVYGRLAGYEDINDAERLSRDPLVRAIVSPEGMDRPGSRKAFTLPSISSHSRLTPAFAGAGFGSSRCRRRPWP